MVDMVPLGTLISIRRGTTYKSALLGHPGPYLLGLASIARNGGFRSDSLKTYGGESPESLLVRPGELYASLKDVTQAADLLGSVARLPRDGSAGRLTQDTVRLDIVSERIDGDYLYWLLRAPEYRQYCRAHATGTTNLGLPREDFLSYLVRLPSIDEQRRMANTLGALDDLIDTNETLSAGLRQLQVAAVRELSQFATRAVELGTIAAVRREKPAGDSETPYLGLEHFAEDGRGINSVGRLGDVGSQQQAFRKGDLLYGRLRPYFRKVDRVGFDGACTGEIWVVRPSADVPVTWLSAILSTPEFTDFAMA